MRQFSDMLEKVNLDNLISYLIVDENYSGKKIGGYEEKIEECYENFFEKLEEMYVEADRNDNRLFDLVTDFAMFHENIYFKAGLLMGFHLYKNIDTA